MTEKTWPIPHDPLGCPTSLNHPLLPTHPAGDHFLLWKKSAEKSKMKKRRQSRLEMVTVGEKRPVAESLHLPQPQASHHLVFLVSVSASPIPLPPSLPSCPLPPLPHTQPQSPHTALVRGYLLRGQGQVWLSRLAESKEGWLEEMSYSGGTLRWPRGIWLVVGL